MYNMPDTPETLTLCPSELYIKQKIRLKEKERKERPILK